MAKIDCRTKGRILKLFPTKGLQIVPSTGIAHCTLKLNEDL